MASATRERSSQSRQVTRETPSAGSRSQLPLFSPDGRPAAKGGAHKHKKLGMFKGVLVPTCENMWGVIIFLRFYTIVGYAGLGYTFIIVTLSFSVALLTALALSAIATCGTSHSIAGVYPMLARALGKEVATATGLMYFLGIVCLAVLECLGACEQLFQVTPELADIGGYQLWGFIFLASLSLFVGGGIQVVSKLGLAFFAVVIVTLGLLYASLIGAPYLTALDAPDPSRAFNASDPAHASGSSSDSSASNRRALAGGGGPIDPNAPLIFPSGLSGANFASNFAPSFEGSFQFADCLGIFFPCFTGILSGANRASALRDPVSAIPNGTLGAICTSYVMYTTLMVLWAGVGSRAYLKATHGQIDTLFYPAVIMAQVGIILSSLGQALQCLVVAPRLLASIAASGTIRVLKPFAILTAGEPKRALLITWFIGSCITMLGSLNLVAPLLSMCFLLCYACMNINSFLLDFLKDPHWRPKWRWFHWTIGLAGFVLCVVVMFLIQPVYAVIAWAMCLILLYYIIRSNASHDWGSALTGLRFHVAIRSLLSIDMKEHLNQNWKPQLLLLYTLREVEQLELNQKYDEGFAPDQRPLRTPSPKSSPAALRQQQPAADMEQVVLDMPDGVVERAGGSIAGHTHEHMFSVAHQLRHGSGLIIAAAIMQMGEGQANHDLMPVIAAEEEEHVMTDLMKDMGVQGFAMTVLTHDATEGKAYAIQCAGLGPLTPNTVLMGWPWWWKSNPDKYVPEFLSTIHQATLRQKALLVCHNVKDFPTNDEPQTGFIDVWWIKHDGGLLLLISHLLQKHRVWRRCGLRLHLITEVGTDPEHLKQRIHKLLNRINITASVEEVIQIDTDSLLPYMTASRERERNEALAGAQVRAAGKSDHQVHTAEELLVQPSPNPKAAHAENPLDHVREPSFHEGLDALDPSHTDKSLLSRLKLRRSSTTPRYDETVDAPATCASPPKVGRRSSAPAVTDPNLVRRASSGLIQGHSGHGGSACGGSSAAGSAYGGSGHGGSAYGGSHHGGSSPLPLSSAALPRRSSATLPRVGSGLRTLTPSPLSVSGRGAAEDVLKSTARAMGSTPPPSPPGSQGIVGSDSSPSVSSSAPQSPYVSATNPTPSSPKEGASAPSAASAQRWSLVGTSSQWGSRSQLMQLPPPVVQSTDEEPGSVPAQGSPQNSPTKADGVESSASRRRRRSFTRPFTSGGEERNSGEATPLGGEGVGVGVEMTGSGRESSRGASNIFGILQRGNSKPEGQQEPATPNGGAGSAGEGSASGEGPGAFETISETLMGGLAGFIEKYGLGGDASDELKDIFSSSVKKIQAQVANPGPRYRWDQIHEMICAHSPGTSLVIVNLPDPPELDPQMSEEEQMAELLGYMNYMEGVAENLPRVLYVHGSGQEVINFDALG